MNENNGKRFLPRLTHHTIMKIYFSFDYKGGMAYLGMKEQPVMMDTMVVDFNKLLDFLELRLGLHTIKKSDAD